MIITVKSKAYNNNITASGEGCNAQLTINNTTPLIYQKVTAGGATGPPGLGASPIFIQSTENRLQNLENKESHQWKATQW